MDSTGITGTGQYVANTVEATVKAQQAKEASQGKQSMSLEELDVASLKERLKAYIELADQLKASDSGSGGLTEPVVESESLVQNLIGTHPLYPFDQSVMDVYSEFAKRYVNGEVNITGEDFEQIKQQVEKLSVTLGTAKAEAKQPAAAAPEAEEQTPAPETTPAEKLIDEVV